MPQIITALPLNQLLNLEGEAIAITGHRPNKLGDDYALTSPFVQKISIRIQVLINEIKPDYIISGMALGIDTLMAILAIQRSIPLIAAIPFEQQDSNWPNRSRSLYRELLGKAHMVINVSGKNYCNHAYMQLRNEWMVDNCTHLIAVFDGSPGGTANCLKYAQSKMKQEDITIINPTLL